MNTIQVQWRIQDFPLGGGGRRPVGGGHGPLRRTLLDENICENKRNGSCWGLRALVAPPWICQ